MKKYVQAWEYKLSGLSTQEIATLMGTDVKYIRKFIGAYRKKNEIKYVEEKIDFGKGFCKVCGNEFDKKNDIQYYCSARCRNKASHQRNYEYKSVNQVNKYPINEIIKMYESGYTCVEIGELYNLSGGTVSYHLKKNGIRVSTTKPIRNYQCVQCGKTFQAKKGNSKYCSKACHSKWKKNNPKYFKVCEYCGKEFKTNMKKRRLCSVQCMGANHKKKFDNEEVVNQYGTKEQREEKFKEDFNTMFSNKAIYVDGFKDGDSRFNCQCLKCGTIYTLGAQIVRKKGKAECPFCEKERLAIKARKERLTKYREYIKKNISNMKLTLKVDRTFVCSYCGKEFRALRKNKFCSKECLNKYNNYHNSSKRNERIKSNGHYDWSISIPKLIKRDKVCKLCGKPVDIHDRVNAKGTVIVGQNYPSIDHIIPVSKGGTHTWDNVQLAHVGCNTKKSNTTDVVARIGKVQLSLNI